MGAQHLDVAPSTAPPDILGFGALEMVDIAGQNAGSVVRVRFQTVPQQRHQTAFDPVKDASFLQINRARDVFVDFLTSNGARTFPEIGRRRRRGESELAGEFRVNGELLLLLLVFEVIVGMPANPLSIH